MQSSSRAKLFPTSAIGFEKHKLFWAILKLQNGHIDNWKSGPNVPTLGYFNEIAQFTLNVRHNFRQIGWLLG